jgi:hypothetical protein
MNAPVIPEAAKCIRGLLDDIANSREDDAIRKINSEYIGLRLEYTKTRKNADSLQMAYRSLEPFLKSYDKREDFREKAKHEAVKILKTGAIVDSVEIERKLDWVFDGGGEWCAQSHYHDDGSAFLWRVSACQDGTFCVSDSDKELTQNCNTFKTLREAQSFCESDEFKSILHDLS